LEGILILVRHDFFFKIPATPNCNLLSNLPVVKFGTDFAAREQEHKPKRIENPQATEIEIGDLMAGHPPEYGSIRMYLTTVRAALLSMGLLAFTTQTLQASASNPPDVYPFLQGLTSCTACHNSNAENAGVGNFSVSGLPESYTPGEKYPITIQVSHPSAVRFGFTMSSTASSGDQVGKFHSNSEEVDARTEDGVMYIKQSYNGTEPQDLLGAGSKSWTVLWQAPAEPDAIAIFEVRGLAADGDEKVTGDSAYSLSFSVRPAGTTAD